MNGLGLIWAQPQPFLLTVQALLSGVRERPSNGSYARNPTWCALQSRRSGIC